MIILLFIVNDSTSFRYKGTSALIPIHRQSIVSCQFPNCSDTFLAAIQFGSKQLILTAFSFEIGQKTTLALICYRKLKCRAIQTADCRIIFGVRQLPVCVVTIYGKNLVRSALQHTRRLPSCSSLEIASSSSISSPQT